MILDPMALWGLSMPRHKAEALIQAAPDLLEKLEEAVELLTVIAVEDRCEPLVDLTEFRMAIAKAKGA